MSDNQRARVLISVAAIVFRATGLEMGSELFQFAKAEAFAGAIDPSPSFDPRGVHTFAFHSLYWPRASRAAEFPVLQGHLARHLP
jgi:hypothetical protein